MKPMTKITSPIVAVMTNNVDTDQLVPRDALKETSKTDLAATLFHGQRYLASGAKNPDFPLNDPTRAAAQILITGENCGMGSVWEQAVWALRDYGFRAVIAKSFNDIFYMNCIKNGVLPLTLAAADCDWLAALPATTVVTIDLAQLTVQAADKQFKFTIDPLWQDKLLQGITDIEMTDSFDAQIAQFEQQQNKTE